MFTGIEGSEPSLPPTCQVVYAVVDKTKNKSAGKCDNFQTVGMDKRPKTENGKFSSIPYLAIKDKSNTICMFVLVYVDC